MPPQNDYTDLIPFSVCTFVFNHSSPEEVYAAIKNLKKEGSKSDISMKFIKMCGMRLATILCNFFNMCFREQTYPNKFKCSIITPLYKKTVRTCIENHGPVASMCNLSKIFDSLIHERLTDYFMDNGLLSGNQFGFRQGRNTELAVFHLIDKIFAAFEMGSYCICVFLDFSACFDTISRDILCSKLYRYGVSGSELFFFNVISKIELSLSRIQLLNHSFVSRTLVQFKAQN